MLVRIVLSLFFVFATLNAQCQLPKKALKLEGTWRHTHDNGFELWRHENGVLIGEAYRVTNQMDTLKIEEMKITFEANKYLLRVIVYNQNDGKEITFVSSKKKLHFENASHDFPRAIVYKFNCFSKKKMKAFIYHPHKDKLPHRISFVKIN